MQMPLGPAYVMVALTTVETAQMRRPDAAPRVQKSRNSDRPIAAVVQRTCPSDAVALLAVTLCRSCLYRLARWGVSESIGNPVVSPQVKTLLGGL